MLISPSGQWHVLYVLSRQEKKVYTHLTRQNLEAFLPLVKRMRQWSDRKKLVEMPLFPSYVFVKVHSKHELLAAKTVQGVADYVRVGSTYARLPAHEVDSIKALINAKDFNEVQSGPLPQLQIGQQATIACGPLTNLACRVVKIQNEHKIIVHIDALQQCITATVPASYLEAPAKAHVV